ncbi:MAG TPA: hypothetical protein VJ624_11155 [Thermodesulfobacteriota bacterium]|nr:hypothetical protein [Thermodesulfobacteriota bacterium]
MKLIFKICLVILLTMGIFSLAIAQDKTEMKGGKGMMGKQGMMTEHGKMMGDKCWMMSHMMMDKSLVATEDGGVIVMVGNKLQKYDKDLVLQKEVEIKIDLEGMQKTMMEMMGKCPLHKKMMQEEGMMGETKK